MKAEDLTDLVCVLANCTQTLLDEIGDKQFTRKDVATTYGMAIVSHKYGETVDWAAVNKAIVERWSVSALEFIKRRAWKYAEGR